MRTTGRSHYDAPRPYMTIVDDTFTAITPPPEGRIALYRAIQEVQATAFDVPLRYPFDIFDHKVIHTCKTLFSHTYANASLEESFAFSPVLHSFHLLLESYFIDLHLSKRLCSDASIHFFSRMFAEMKERMNRYREEDGELKLNPKRWVGEEHGKEVSERDPHMVDAPIPQAYQVEQNFIYRVFWRALREHGREEITPRLENPFDPQQEARMHQHLHKEIDHDGRPFPSLAPREHLAYQKYRNRWHYLNTTEMFERLKSAFEAGIQAGDRQAAIRNMVSLPTYDREIDKRRQQLDAKIKARIQALKISLAALPILIIWQPEKALKLLSVTLPLVGAAAVQQWQQQQRWQQPHCSPWLSGLKSRTLKASLVALAAMSAAWQWLAKKEN